MEERSRAAVRQLLERARSEWRGVEFVVYAHPDLVESLADDGAETAPHDDPSLRRFMESDLRPWDVCMDNPPPSEEVHVRPFYGNALPEGIPEYSVVLGRTSVC